MSAEERHGGVVTVGSFYMPTPKNVDAQNRLIEWEQWSKKSGRRINKRCEYCRREADVLTWVSMPEFYMNGYFACESCSDESVVKTCRKILRCRITREKKKEVIEAARKSKRQAAIRLLTQAIATNSHRVWLEAIHRTDASYAYGSEFGMARSWTCEFCGGVYWCDYCTDREYEGQYKIASGTWFMFRGACRKCVSIMRRSWSNQGRNIALGKLRRSGVPLDESRKVLEVQQLVKFGRELTYKPRKGN